MNSAPLAFPLRLLILSETGKGRENGFRKKLAVAPGEKVRLDKFDPTETFGVGKNDET
jgi:hypothetical protein